MRACVCVCVRACVCVRVCACVCAWVMKQQTKEGSSAQSGQLVRHANNTLKAKAVKCSATSQLYMPRLSNVCYIIIIQTVDTQSRH